MRLTGKEHLYSTLPVPSNATMTSFWKKKPGTDSVKILVVRWQHPAFLSTTVTRMCLGGLVEITRVQHKGLLTWKCAFTRERTVASITKSFPSRIVAISMCMSLWDYRVFCVIVGLRNHTEHLHYNGDREIQSPFSGLKFAACWLSG